MNKKSRTPIRISILGVLLIALVFAVYSSFAEEKAVKPGDTAPNFSLQQLNGPAVKLSDLRGQGVVLNFWGTWCGPCKSEMPLLEKYYQTYKDKGLVVVGVNIGEGSIPVQQFVKQVGTSFPIWMDKEKEITKLYKIGPIPTTFFIDKDGKVQDIFIGEMKEPVIRQKVDKILP